MFNSQYYSHTCHEQSVCTICLKTQLDELRSRLRALEQNTTPARPAEQKPDQTPREWFACDGHLFEVHERAIAHAWRGAFGAFGTPSKIIRVREVI